LARAAKAERLEGYGLLDLIEQYAVKFGLDPDWVFSNTKFGTLTTFIIKWKEEGEYQDRYFELERLMHAK
jgi:hypothetical protein